MITPFAHTCANRSAPLTASPAMCRPSGSVFPRTLTGQLLGRTMANRQQAGKGTADHSPLFAAGEITHRNPKAQPYCAGCGCWISAYPFNTTNLCEKCEEECDV